MELINAAEVVLAQAEQTIANPHATPTDWARALGAAFIDFSALLPGLPPEFRKKMQALGFAAIKANP